MQSYDFLLNCPNVFAIIFLTFCKLLFYSVLCWGVFVFFMRIWHAMSLYLGVFGVIVGLFLERFERKKVNCYANCDKNE